MPVQECPPRFLAVARRGDAQALALQEFGEEITDLTVVIDDQDMRQGFHVCYNSAQPGGCAVVVAIGDNSFAPLRQRAASKKIDSPNPPERLICYSQT